MSDGKPSQKEVIRYGVIDLIPVCGIGAGFFILFAKTEYLSFIPYILAVTLTFSALNVYLLENKSFKKLMLYGFMAHVAVSGVIFFLYLQR